MVSSAVDVKTSADFSPCRTYRYALWRTWGKAKPYALFICLNPSTADETDNDPTVTRCIDFAKQWGFGGLCMANLFAFRATQPKDLKQAKDPVGDANDKWLSKLHRDAGLVVAAWGNDGKFLGRADEVTKQLPNLYCLKINKSGEPAHPLYLKKGLKPAPYIKQQEI